MFSYLCTLPLYAFEQGRARSNQFEMANFGAQDMYTKRFKPFAFLRAAIDFLSKISNMLTSFLKFVKLKTHVIHFVVDQ